MHGTRFTWTYCICLERESLKFGLLSSDLLFYVQRRARCFSLRNQWLRNTESTGYVTYSHWQNMKSVLKTMILITSTFDSYFIAKLDLRANLFDYVLKFSNPATHNFTSWPLVCLIETDAAEIRILTTLCWLKASLSLFLAVSEPFSWWFFDLPFDWTLSLIS